MASRGPPACNVCGGGTHPHEFVSKNGNPMTVMCRGPGCSMFDKMEDTRIKLAFSNELGGLAGATAKLTELTSIFQSSNDEAEKAVLVRQMGQVKELIRWLTKSRTEVANLAVASALDQQTTKKYAQTASVQALKAAQKTSQNAAELAALAQRMAIIEKEQARQGTEQARQGTEQKRIAAVQERHEAELQRHEAELQHQRDEAKAAAELTAVLSAKVDKGAAALSSLLQRARQADAERLKQAVAGASGAQGTTSIVAVSGFASGKVHAFGPSSQ